MTIKSSIDQVVLAKMLMVEDARGILRVHEYHDNSIRRTFVIHSFQGVSRGGHAHKECSQWLLTTKGTLEVTVSDGVESRTELLEESSGVLFIPPGIWVEIFFVSDGSLVVGADRHFQENDYIRDWEDFLGLKGIS